MTPNPLPAEYYAKLNWPVDKFPALNPGDFSDDASFGVLRRSAEQQRADAKDDENVHVFWKHFPTRDGTELSILFYARIKDRSSSSRPPLLVAIHGGGWVMGDYAVEDALCRHAVHRLGCMAASIHYRLSPKHQFPVPLNDCVDALKYLIQSSEDLAFDSSTIILASSSAGGSLACGVFQVLRDKLEDRVCGLLLNIPVTCDPLHFPEQVYSNRSWNEHANAPLLSAEAMMFCFQSYFPERRKEPLISPLLSPMLATFPPTAIIVADFDPMRDQGIALKLALDNNGIPTRLKVFKDVPHGFHLMGPPQVAQEGVNEMVEGVAWMLQLKEKKSEQ